LVVVATLGDAGIGIELLDGQTIVDHVPEGLFHETTTAALVPVVTRAVDDLLVGKLDKVLRLTLDDVQTLHGGHGRKCPISCAFSLN
jgi:hypothetical protein